MTQLGDPDDMAVSDAHGLGVGRFQSPAPKDRRLSSSPLVDNLPFAVDALSITTKLNVLTPTRQMSEGQTARVFRARGPDGGDYAVKILARDRDAERRAANEGGRTCSLRVYMAYLSSRSLIFAASLVSPASVLAQVGMGYARVELAICERGLRWCSLGRNVGAKRIFEHNSE